MKYALRLTVLAAISLAVTNLPAYAQIPPCGDVNGDFAKNISDVVRIIDHLHVNELPLPYPGQADIDTYRRVTTHDAIVYFDEVFFTPPPIVFTCPGGNPPLTPPVDPAYRLIYTDRVPANASSAVISVEITSPVALDWITLPGRIELEGVAQPIDSIVVDTPFTNNVDFFGFDFYRNMAGEFNYLAFQIFNPVVSSGTHHLMDIYLSVTPAPVNRTVDMTLITMNPFNAPGAQSDIIPMFVDHEPINYPNPIVRHPHTPVIQPTFLCGDANHDYVIEPTDAQIIAEHYFQCGPAPTPLAAGDVNCDGVINIKDIVIINAYVKGLNPTLCCQSTPFPPQGDLPPPYTPTAEQDSLYNELTLELRQLGM